LLSDIEQTGLPLDQVLLVDICDAKEGIYGAPGKSCQPVQQRFQKVKELSARGYRKLLAKHSIASSSPATLSAEEQEETEQQELAQELPDQEASTQDATNKELVLSDDKEEVTTDNDIDIDI
jgi:hypothetical protein